MGGSITDGEHLHGLVDMGSNGVRFSISDLSPPTTRILPTLYTSRAGISLYDAQYSPSGERVAIPEKIIKAVTNELEQFKRTCADFGVPAANVTVLATEATRTAINSGDFRQRIKDVTGWEVSMLAKEEEGRVGALGVATSLGVVRGLVMDLGGGSTQLTWLTTTPEGAIQMPARGAVSMPFGAAALTRRLGEAERAGGNARDVFADEVKTTIKNAYESLEVPAELHHLAKAEGGFALYLSGGGFRGWGFVLMSQHAVQPYPIPVINGLVVQRSDFLDTVGVQATLQEDMDNDDAIFRVSQRRASQVPAVAFLVRALSEALPQIKQVRFCQGGVREGFLFSRLIDDVRMQRPVTVATQPLAAPGASHYASLLAASLPASPSSFTDRQAGSEATFTPALLAALGNMLNYYSTHPKDIRAASALRSTTTGVLASAHGLAHEERAILALTLCERWGGASDLPPADLPFFRSMQALAGAWSAWWARYLGRVAALVGEVYPSGRGREVLALSARWGATGKGNNQIVLQARTKDGRVRELFGDELAQIGKAGKKKHWIGGKDGCGHRVEVA
ncbi:hypothetical protein AAFC00_001242 [Neodothiora populina]|uniref:Retrograde regulation protein 2 n=1 Tax=Neodothiora populina TaxID=2781224 RepID=A0ABR3PNA2_9PEZI